MITVLGRGTHAVLAAAYASAMSDEAVGVDDETIAAPRESRRLEVDGLDGGMAFAEVVGCDDAWLAGTGHFVLIGPPGHLVDTCNRYAEFLTGKNLLLAPGCFAGAARTVAAFAARDIDAPAVGELPGFPVIGDRQGDRIRVRGVKVGMPCGTLPGSDDFSAAYARYLPPTRPAATLETSLSNTNNIIHPPIVLANLATISRGAPLRFYREGISPAVGQLIRATDRERLAVGAATGVRLSSIEEVFGGYYAGNTGDSGRIDEILTTFPGFSASFAPTSLDHRYIADDVDYGMACFAALGDLVGVDTPTIDGIVMVLCTAAGRDLRTRAHSLATLLITAEQITSP